MYLNNRQYTWSVQVQDSIEIFINSLFSVWCQYGNKKEEKGLLTRQRILEYCMSINYKDTKLIHFYVVGGTFKH